MVDKTDASVMKKVRKILKENDEEIKIKYKSEFFALQNEKLLNQIDFLNKENHRLKHFFIPKNP